MYLGDYWPVREGFSGMVAFKGAQSMDLINFARCSKCRMPTWWHDAAPTSCRHCGADI